MSTKSDTWYHFVKKGSSGVCKYCHVEVKTCGNTTNLRNHLLRRHPCIKSVSQRKLVVASDGIGVGVDKKETGVCTCTFSLQYRVGTFAFFLMHACLKMKYSCIFYSFIEFIL